MELQPQNSLSSAPALNQAAKAVSNPIPCDPVFNALMQMSIEQVAKLPLSHFLQHYLEALRTLETTEHSFASRSVQLARLMALHHHENEPDGSFERPFHVQSKAIDQGDPADTEIHPLKVFDIGVESKLLGSARPALLRAICHVQERCAIPVEKMGSSEACTGLFFAHTIKELRQVLSVEGAQVATLEDGQGALWGTYLAHFGEIATEDLQLVERALKYLDRFCADNNLDQRELPEMPHVAHLICIDPAIRNFHRADGSSYSRRQLYGDLHAPIVWESWRTARRQGMHSSLMVATCRPDNPALAVHKDAGWVDLTEQYGAEPLQKYVEIPGTAERRKFEFHILALSTASARQDDFINREFPQSDCPKMGWVPFVDLDPSNGVMLPEIQPRS